MSRLRVSRPTREPGERLEVVSLREHVEARELFQDVAGVAQGTQIARQRDRIARTIRDVRWRAPDELGQDVAGAAARRVEHDEIEVLSGWQLVELLAHVASDEPDRARFLGAGGALGGLDRGLRGFD